MHSLNVLPQESGRRRRGRLKIFLGAAPGVGKTSAMLEAGQRLRAEGQEVLLGCVETHGSRRTTSLLVGLEPAGRGEPAELDLDAALRRRPQLLLVDDLAHQNPAGARHPRRWQDVLELLDAGIDVFTTLDVLNVESLNDVIAGITQVRVTATVPDEITERADDIQVVDLSPDEITERRAAQEEPQPGSATAPAARDRDRAFRRGDLLALRELMLRLVAERVDVEVRAYRKSHGIAETWAAGERLLVCVGPSPLSERVVRAARRMATGLRAPWLAAYVETPQHARLSAADAERLGSSLRLAESLGAEVVTLSGDAVAKALVDYARRHNVTKILIGKPTHPRWRDLLLGSLVDELIRGSGDIDVYVITGEAGDSSLRTPRLAPSEAPPAAYGLGALVPVFATALALGVDRYFGLTEVIMVYLLAIVLSALRYGRGPALLTSALSVGAFNFLFVPPRYTFAVSDVRYLFTFVGMFIIGLVISDLTARGRWQADMALFREQHTSALYGLARALSRERDTAALARRAAAHVAAVFSCQALVLLPRGEARSAAGRSPDSAAPELEPAGSTSDAFVLDESERGAAAWAFGHNDAAGLGTHTMPGHPSLHLPLSATTHCIGVLAVRPNEGMSLLDPAQRKLLLRFCDQIALALERALWAEEAQRTALRAEKESLRNTLLSSVSHDLRTPLAAIAGAASTLLDQDARQSEVPAVDSPEGAARMTAGQRRELLSTICEESEHLNRLVRNLLDMTRLQFGGLALRKEWVPLGEVVGSALNRLEQRLGQHSVVVSLPHELPLIPMDPVLTEQLFTNLLENAIKHTPPGTPIEIGAGAAPNMVTVAVADRGPGIPPDSEEQVFEKFFRGPYRRSGGGVGLGLTICRSIVEAHGGQISAASRSGGGAVFCFTLPIDGEPPRLPPEQTTDLLSEHAGEQPHEPAELASSHGASRR